MTTILSGKKTYIAAVGAILTALQPMFTDSGIDLSLVNAELLWAAIIGIFLRQGVAKSGPAEPNKANVSQAGDSGRE